MRRAILGVVMTALACLSAAPASAQAPTDYEYLSRFPLNLKQRQLIGAIRENDRELYITFARHITKQTPAGVTTIKPLAEWTQADFEEFTNLYIDYQNRQLAGLTSGSPATTLEELRALQFFRKIITDGSSSEGEDD